MRGGCQLSTLPDATDATLNSYPLSVQDVGWAFGAACDADIKHLAALRAV